MRTGKPIEWNEERIDIIRKYYHHETNEQVAKRLGISSRSLVRKVKELQLYKSERITISKQIEDTVRKMYCDYSLSEIAADTGSSWRTIRRIVKSLGLTRTKEQERQMRSRIRQNLIESERRRINWGFDQHTDIKVVCNHERIRLRSKLKRFGYIVFRGSNTIYYPVELKRHPIRERHGLKLGLEFAPWCPPAILDK